MIDVRNLSKSFTLHTQGGTVLPVMDGATSRVATGECVGLIGVSGSGKSTLMRMIWGNYLAASRSIMIVDVDVDVDVATAAPRQIIALRRSGLGYVSQFLRVVPRVPTLDVMAEPLLHALHLTSYGFLAGLSGVQPSIVSVWGTDVLEAPSLTPAHRWITSPPPPISSLSTLSTTGFLH